MSFFRTVVGTNESTLVLERSKFICQICPIQNEEEAKAFIEKVKKEHPFATHHCYAYIADAKGNLQKFSDDREPQGTAGQPILEAIKSKNVCKIVAVVIRYFGGVKLGTGRLARAYSWVVRDCISKTEIVSYIDSSLYTIKLSYDDYQKFYSAFRFGDNVNAEITLTEYLDEVSLSFVVSKKDEESVLGVLSNKLNGKIDFKPIESGFYPFKRR